MKKWEAFDDEVKFKVGERVKIYIEELEKDKDVGIGTTTGVITGAHTRFAVVPEYRSFSYSVRLDGDGKYYGSMGSSVRYSQEHLSKVD